MVHFKGLNAIRGIAAIAVFIAHIVQSRRYFLLPDPDALILRSTELLGGHAVSVFFTLSGFLITYLLLLEKKYAGTINIYHFYVRRILRIWPLYYLYLLLAIIFAFYFKMQSIPGDIFFYIFLAGNVPLILHDGFPFLAHYWSLGVEEQFYLIWPFVVKFYNRNLARVILITVFILALLKAVFFGYFYNPAIRSILAETLRTTRFENMMLGALLAYILMHYESVIDFMTKKYIQFLAWCLFVIIFFEVIHLPNSILELLLSVTTCFIIVSQIKDGKSIIRLESPFLNFLGKISYGIYVFHPLVIYLVSRIIKRYEFSLTMKYIIAYGFSGILTIFTAYISYEFFEKWFLKKKASFSVLLVG